MLILGREKKKSQSNVDANIQATSNETVVYIRMPFYSWLLLQDKQFPSELVVLW